MSSTTNSKIKDESVTDTTTGSNNIKSNNSINDTVSNNNNSHGNNSTATNTSTNSRIVEQDNDDIPGEATLLVSEFPPPPFYYTRALHNYRTTIIPSSNNDNINNNNNIVETSEITTTVLLSSSSSLYGLVPPEIPIDALSRGTRRAAAAAARARTEAERLRLIEIGDCDTSNNNNDRTSAILGSGSSTIGGNNLVTGTGATTVGTSCISGTGGVDGTTPNDDNNKNNKEEEDGKVVAVFGEIVEDPLQVVSSYTCCDDPKVVRTELKKLNKLVVLNFVQLVSELVTNPTSNKLTRNKLSHNIFLMLQQCNKFRDHQAREIIISLLEKQLYHRTILINELHTIIKSTTSLLQSTNK